MTSLNTTEPEPDLSQHPEPETEEGILIVRLYLEINL